MRKNIKILFVVGLIFAWSTRGYAWSGKTHSALTEKAISDSNQSTIEEYLENQLGIDQGLNCILLLDESITPDPDRVLPEIPANTSVLDLLKAGSYLEDNPRPRARHHFHDPYRNTGLDNKTEHPMRAVALNKLSKLLYGIGFDLTGASTLKRALGTEEQQWEQEYENYFAWPDTRDYFYKALTEESEDTREHYLALTFLSLGHVLHLLEDMGVSAHARNDFIEAHFRVPTGMWDNPLESHVEDETGSSGIPARWLEGWVPQAKIFSKLADYWDVNDYLGQYVGTSPLSDWGLSECSNYQFLSKSTIFRENNGTKYYFPHPDVNNVTGYIKPGVYDWGSVPVHYKYISGYDITHLGRTKFIQKYAYMAGMPYPTETVAYHTTFDEAVYEDYAKVTIPRTIDYTTGLSNYFFRGRLNAEPNWVDPNIAILTITNDSNNSGAPQTLKGGTFELYWDDKDGNRAEVNDFSVDGWEPSSILDYNDTVTATFTQLTDAAVYTLVYKGDICENPDDLDTDDPNAIAIAVFRPGYAIITWGRDDYGQVTDAPDGNDFVAIAAGKRHCLALKSDGSLVAWGYNTYGECNVPDGTDYTAIAAGTNHSIALKSDGSIVVWGRDNFWQITDKPSGNDFVAIAAGDYHSLALKTNDIIVGWGGWNDFGECDAPASDPGTVYTAITAGSYHSLALQSDGTVKAWGNNNLGQTRIYAGAGNDHEAVAACFNYNLLLKEDDMLIAWGGGDWREPGIPRYHYRQPDGTDFVTIAAGWDHILALTSDGEIFAWDWPFGDFPFDYFSRPVPPDVVFIEDIDAGYDFSVALRLP